MLRRYMITSRSVGQISENVGQKLCEPGSVLRSTKVMVEMGSERKEPMDWLHRKLTPSNSEDPPSSFFCLSLKLTPSYIAQTQ